MQSPIVYLARTYFHQDYDLEAPTPAGVLLRFRDDESAEVVENTRSALVDALSSSSEDTLADLWLRSGGASYDPRVDGVSMTDWFSTMATALKPEASTPQRGEKSPGTRA